MSLAKKLANDISEKEYLDGELLSEIKHEYIDGYVYAMAGASRKHNLIAKNTIYSLENSLRASNSSCDIFSSDMKVRVADEHSAYFYPDVIVSCESDDNESEYFTDTPLIIVEVLSKSTRKNDLSSKKLYYFNIPTLEEYIVIEQNFCEVEVFRKSDGWKSTVYFLGDDITLASIDMSLSVEEIYYHVKNDDMEQFIKAKEDK